MSVLAIVRRVLAASVLAPPLLTGPPAAVAPLTDSCLWRKSVLNVYTRASTRRGG